MRTCHFLDFVMLRLNMITGHTAEFSPRDGEPKLFMKNVPFHENERFVFDQLHFHFGRNIYEGSEHRVNDFAFSGEVKRFHSA